MRLCGKENLTLELNSLRLSWERKHLLGSWFREEVDRVGFTSH